VKKRWLGKAAFCWGKGGKDQEERWNWKGRKTSWRKIIYGKNNTNPLISLGMTPKGSKKEEGKGEKLTGL